MGWKWTALAIATLIIFFRALASKRKAKTKKLPPGPTGLPILGNLLMLGKNPHRDLYRLAQKYGAIMHFRVGLVPIIVVSSPQAAELFLKTHDLIFASRPAAHQGSEHNDYNQKNLSFSPYGSYWRNMRKFCTLQLFTDLKIKSFRSMRKQELQLLIEHIQMAASARVVVDVSAKVSSLSTNMSCRMVLGKKYSDVHFDEKSFKAVTREGLQICSAFDLADYVPHIKLFDLQRKTKRMKAAVKDVYDLFEKIIDEHVRSRDENRAKDFVDAMLELMESEETDQFHIDRDNIKAVLLDMILAALDTSAVSIEWALSELIKHPSVMKKAQKELGNVVGMDRMVEECDLEKLKYLDMIVKESFRLHPVAPLLLPHASMEDCVVNGFHIPKNSLVFINAWAIGRDPNVWIDAEKFLPERFEFDGDGGNIDLRGHHFQLIPFGSGRRGCPGLQLGLTVVRLVIAQLVHCFDWELPDNMVPTQLDMTEDFTIACPRANPLLAIPTWRLKK